MSCLRIFFVLTVVFHHRTIVLGMNDIGSKKVVYKFVFGSFFFRLARVETYLFLYYISFYLLDKEQAITCGSAVKLRHLGTKFYLNSGEMAWGTGSGQQVVTLGKTKKFKFLVMASS